MCPHDETFTYDFGKGVRKGRIVVCANCGQILKRRMPKSCNFLRRKKQDDVKRLMESWHDITVGRENYSD